MAERGSGLRPQDNSKFTIKELNTENSRINRFSPNQKLALKLK